MKTTYSFPILCSLNGENKITNFCTLELNNFQNNDFFSKIANELNLNFSLPAPRPWQKEGVVTPLGLQRPLGLQQQDQECIECKKPPALLIHLAINNEIEKNVGITTEDPFDPNKKDIGIISYLIDQIETLIDPNSYVIIPANTEIIGIPQITGSFDKNTNTFSPAENPNFPQENGWEIDPSVIGPFFKPKPDETYLFDFEENEWFPNPELDYDLHGDGKPYRYNSENKSWYPNWEPEPE
jgi:hypothetical protein